MVKLHTCKSCGNEFAKPHNPNRAYIFCSYSCRGRAVTLPRLNKNCEACGICFEVNRNDHPKDRRFCSAACYNRSRDRGRTTAAFRFRTSKVYAQWRTSVFERDGYKCQICGVRGGKLCADHIKRFSDYPELRLALSNGRTLCQPCHLSTPTYGNRKVAGAQE